MFNEKELEYIEAAVRHSYRVAAGRKGYQNSRSREDRESAARKYGNTNYTEVTEDLRALLSKIKINIESKPMSTDSIDKIDMNEHMQDLLARMRAVSLF